MTSALDVLDSAAKLYASEAARVVLPIVIVVILLEGTG
jgi:hypothetical protein